MLERIARRWHVRSVELKRFGARDEGVAARNRRLRRRGARLHCGCLGLVSEGGRAGCQRECRYDCAHSHLLSPTARARPASPCTTKEAKRRFKLHANIILPLLTP